MNVKKSGLRSACPVNYGLEQLGDKWTLLVIRDLIFEGKRFYKEFLASEEGIATNVLSDRLKRLEASGIIVSAVNESQRTQKIYALTAKGLDLVPVLVELMIWSAQHKDGLNISAGFVAKLATDKDAIIQAIRASVGTKTFSANQP